MQEEKLPFLWFKIVVDPVLQVNHDQGYKNQVSNSHSSIQVSN